MQVRSVADSELYDIKGDKIWGNNTSYGKGFVTPVISLSIQGDFLNFIIILFL